MNNSKHRWIYLLATFLLAPFGVTTTHANLLHNPQQIEQLNQHLQQAYSQYQQQELNAARTHYQHVLTQLPNNPDALLGLGQIALQQQQPLQAISHLSQLLTTHPNHPLANAQLALISGKTEQQEGLLHNLLRLKEHPSLYFALGNLYAEQQRWTEAQQAYSRAQRLAPQQTEYLLNLAISLDHLGQHQQALVYYRASLSNQGPQTQQIEKRIQWLSQHE